MPLVILEDSSMLQFDNEKYYKRTNEKGEAIFILKSEFASRNRPTKIVLDFVNKTYYEEFVGGHPRTLKYAEVI